METIDTYIVRIYRRDKDDPRNIAGVVEIVGGDERRTFSNRDELLASLDPLKRKRLRRRTIKKDLSQ